MGVFSFLVLCVIAFLLWRISDQMPDILFRLSEVQKDPLAEMRRQGETVKRLVSLENGLVHYSRVIAQQSLASLRQNAQGNAISAASRWLDGRRRSSASSACCFSLLNGRKSWRATSLRFRASRNKLARPR